jgi:outer membrane protein OmpA-like peptidoglycan-associated protein
LRCAASGGQCVAIGGATGRSYEVVTADVGHTLRVAVDVDGGAATRSAPTLAVPAPAATTPAPMPATVVASVPDSTVRHARLSVTCTGSVALSVCTVTLLSRSGRVIGTGSAASGTPGRRVAVAAKLNAAGRRKLRRSPNGLAVRVAIAARRADDSALAAAIDVTLRLPALRIMRTFHFAPGSAWLNAGTRASLRAIAAWMPVASRATCVGHTSALPKGDPGYRRKLGLARAKAVCESVARKVHTGRVRSVSHAGHDPVADNDTARGRALNRRVQLAIRR